jgi:hypothetical protein
MRDPVRSTLAPVDRERVEAPKRAPVRSEELRVAYRLIPCQCPYIGVPDSICGKEDGTVCCAHSNQLRHGKGRGQKADDNRGAAMCSACHITIDQGSILTKQERADMWDIAHARSVRLLLDRGLWPESVPVPK